MPFWFILLIIALIGNLPAMAQTESSILWQTNLNYPASILIATEDGGMLLGGLRTNNNSDVAISRLDKDGNLLWQRFFGGASNETLKAIYKTINGFILLGESSSPPSEKKTCSHFGGSDIWLVNLDSDGAKIWEASFGGDQDEFARQLIELPDGSFFLFGTSSSSVSGNKTTPGYGSWDIWVLRLWPDGGKQWDRTFGGTEYEAPVEALPSDNGSYLIACTSFSPASGNKIAPRYSETNWPFSSGTDYWLIKMEAHGEKSADLSYGGTKDETLSWFVRLRDGNFLMIGTSRSQISGNKTTYGADWETWFVKVNRDGAKIWDRSYLGGGMIDTFSSTSSSMESLAMRDGEGMVAARSTYSSFFPYASYTTTYFGGRINSDGTFTASQQRLSGLSQVGAARPIAGGLYIFGGSKTGQSGTNYDYALLKGSGGTINTEWSFGGSAMDYLQLITQTSDGGYALLGVSDSGPSGSKTTPFAGQRHNWLLKLQGDRVKPVVEKTTNNALRISWPTAAQGFSLQSKSIFAPDASWTTVSISPQVVNGTNVIVLPATSGERYYRLVK